MIDIGNFDEAEVESYDHDDISYIERCPACGASDLVWEKDQLVDLDGNSHICEAQ